MPTSSRVTTEPVSAALKIVRILMAIGVVGFVLLIVTTMDSKPKLSLVGTGEFHVPRPASLDDVKMAHVLAKMQTHPGLLQDEAVHDRTMRAASVGQKAVFASLLYRGEVQFGGHYGFFRNHSGMMWEDVIDGLELIGAEKHLDIYQDSLKVFPKDPSRDRYYRFTQLDELPPGAFNEVDERFFALHEEESENIEQLAREYIKAHPDEFFLPAEENGATKDAAVDG